MIGAAFAPLLSFFLGLIAKPLIERIERYFLGPQLAVSFDPSAGCLAFFDDTTHPDCTADHFPDDAKNGELYLRIRATNNQTRMAIDCRAFLTGIEKRVQYGWESLLQESIPLIWSYDESNATTEIPNKVVKFFDVFRIYKSSPEFYPRFRSEKGSELKLNALKSAFASKGLFRITVLVSAQNAPSQQLTFTMDTGVWPPEMSKGNGTPSTWYERYNGLRVAPVV